MCGIAGIVRFAGLAPGERRLGLAMAECLRHRGPDDIGEFIDDCASLGHARLSIIDIDAGHQPMSNEDGSIQVVFNGEIYNHRELASGLIARGHRLRTRCDTEVLVHLYEDRGESFVDRLVGMFAIAIWDSRARKLILARDRMGIKPLYWHDDGRRILFGSELKALLVPGDFDASTDPCALADYLTFGHVAAPRTIFRNVRKLEPGCLVACTASSSSVRRYWDIPFGQDAALGPEPDWVGAFAELLDDAVSMRLMSDVPLGAFLSGGVDSSAIVAAMRRGLDRQPGSSPGNLLTHTVGFDESDCDEREAARAVADACQTDHREVMVRPDAVWAAEHLVKHFDEPFADPCAVPMYYLARAARERVTVALAGDGADEMLAGYRRYRFDLAEAAVRSRAPRWLRRSTAGVAGWLYPKADWLPRPVRAKTTLQNLACDDITAHLRSASIRAGRLPAELLRPELLASTGGYDPFDRGRDWFVRCRSTQLLDRLLYVDMKTLLADGILTKVDRASMAAGLEVRVPLLDHRLVELAARMPVSMKLGRLGTSGGKRVLREVVARWLGTHFAQRPKKGFDVPLDAWFRGPLRAMTHDLLTSRQAVYREWIAPKAVGRLLSAHQRGLGNHGHALWTLLCLELWAKRYAAPDAIEALPQQSHRPLAGVRTA